MEKPYLVPLISVERKAVAEVQTRYFGAVSRNGTHNFNFIDLGFFSLGALAERTYV